MRWREIMMEGVSKYLPMFAALYKGEPDNGVIPEFVMKHIKDVDTSFRKEDRVVYMLRWFRLLQARGGLAEIDRSPNPENNHRLPYVESLVKKYEFELNVTGDHNIECVFAIRNYQTFKHIASLNIAEIQRIVWDKQMPSDLLYELEKIEEKWQQERSQEIKHKGYDAPELFLNCGGGWAWYDLNTASCDKESAAMGHCGNAGGNYGDTILSLRRHLGNETYRPSLTFIMNEEGYLGEMKGRNNDKPAEKYHPMILALLRDPRIKGIDGGGYLPAHNFSLSDLDDSEKEALLAAKPSLGELPDQWHEYEITKDEVLGERCLKRLRQDLQERGYDAQVDIARQIIIVDVWRDRDNYLDSGNTSYCYELRSFFNNDLPFFIRKFTNLSQTESDNIADAAYRHLFNELFDEILPHDMDYMFDNMQAGWFDDKIELTLDIDEYLQSVWEDGWHAEYLDEVRGHFYNDLPDMLGGLPEIETMIVRYIYDVRSSGDYGSSTSKQPLPHVTEEMVEAIVNEYGKYAKDSFTSTDSRQQYFDLSK